ncbi:MAG TPA: hypothetical protein VN176_13990 [Verrucomicrobiae bacterium]|jgi:hypothetical protein|nr:hypothetical protein [Verrucomicrobiae bacterium]
MGYRIRVLGTNEARCDLKSLREALRDSNSRAVLKLETGKEENWEQLILSHPQGPEITLIECNPVVEGELGKEELEEFVSEVDHYQPASAVQWLRQYLPKVKVIYALQLLSGTDANGGWDAVHTIQGAIWTKSGGILQADGEGFTNEDGHHILWQFSTDVKGQWSMAVLERGKWVAFKMDLGDPDQRTAFLKGRVPNGVRLL